MGLFDRLRAGIGAQRPLPAAEAAASADDQAIARYRYLLRTAPPETIEQAHAEAFAQLTPAQRQRVLHELAAQMPEAERGGTAGREADAQSVARAATRAELRSPGAIERALGAAGMGMPGVAAGPAASAGYGAPAGGNVFAGTFLSSMAGTVLGSTIAQHFFAHRPDAGGPFADTGHGMLNGRTPDAPVDSHTDVAPGVDTGIDTYGESDSGLVDAFDSDDNYGGFDSSDTFDV